MTEQEAYRILALPKGADAEQIRKKIQRARPAGSPEACGVFVRLLHRKITWR